MWTTHTRRSALSRRRPAIGRALGWLVLALALALLGSACTVSYVIVEGCDESLNLCDDSCVDLEADRDHCGECGLSCSEGRECVLGRCLDECEPGTERCDVACVDVLSSSFHCSACGRACGPGQFCQDGECVGDPCEGTCDPFTEACDGRACVCRVGYLRCGIGCGIECVDPFTDPLNCGECDTDCRVCREGVCGDDCSGFPDLCIDACTDVSFDPANCGACGMPCAADSVCLEGRCVRSEPAGCATCPCQACDLADLSCVDPSPYGVPLCV